MRIGVRLWPMAHRVTLLTENDDSSMTRSDAAGYAVGVFGKLQSLFDQQGDREARQIRMVLPDGFCVALPSEPLCRFAGSLHCGGWPCPSM